MQISTDEVYGSVPEGASRETDELRPRNPYSASKAGADRLAYSYWATYGVPVIDHARVEQLRAVPVSREGHPALRHQRDRRHPGAALRRRPNVRDWLHVDDHCRARRPADRRRATSGEVYNIGGGNEVKNVDLTHRILALVGKPTSLIKPVADRPGHDRRYSLDTSSCRRSAGAPQVPFERGLRETVAWYRENEWWWRPIKEQDPAFRAYYDAQYGRAAPDALPWLVLLWSPARPASPAATCSIIFSNDEPAVAAWSHVRQGDRTATGDRRVHWDAVDLLDREAVARRARRVCGHRSIYHCAGDRRMSANRGRDPSAR